MSSSSIGLRLGRIAWILLLIFISVFLLGGCAYTVHVRGVQFEENAKITAGQRISIEPSPDVESPDTSFTAKIGDLLDRQGFEVTSKADAELIMLYAFDIKSLAQRSRLQPIAGATGGMQTVMREGPFEHTLSLRVVAAEPFRDSGAEEIVWAGGAVLDGAPTESPRFDDLLLLAMLKHFPNETEKTMRERVSIDSPKARRLARTGQAE